MGNQTTTERVLTAPSGVEILTRQQVAEGWAFRPIYALVCSRVAQPMPCHYAGAA